MIVIPKQMRERAFPATPAIASRRTWRKVLTLSFYSTAVVGAHLLFPFAVPALPGVPLALLGIALSVFLGFRTNACYDRWWEARKQWGELISLSRHFARQTLVLDPGDRQHLLALAMAFAHALSDHLRPQRASGRARRHLGTQDRTAIDGSRNAPDRILLTLYRELSLLRERRQLDTISLMTIDRTIAGMGLVQAASERLRSSPVPPAYSILLQRSATLFCMMMPFGFADILSWFTPVFTGMVAYGFYTLDALAGELEEPFDDGPNGMPLAAMADIIEISLRDAMGDTDVPETPVPENFVLW